MELENVGESKYYLNEKKKKPRRTSKQNNRFEGGKVALPIFWPFSYDGKLVQKDFIIPIIDRNYCFKYC